MEENGMVSKISNGTQSLS